MDLKVGLGNQTMTVPEAADFLNISRESVRLMLHDGQISGFRLGRKKILVLRDSLLQYLRDQQALPVYDKRAQAILRRRRASRGHPAARPNTQSRAPARHGSRGAAS